MSQNPEAALRRRQERVGRIDAVQRYLGQLYQQLSLLRQEGDEVKLVQAMVVLASGLRQAATRLDLSPKLPTPSGPPPGGYRVEEVG